jgi:hypothetical protein
MRINNPRLFNGELLATYRKLAQMFGLNYDENTKGWTGTIDINRIPISALVNKDISGYINAGNLLVGDLAPSGIQFEQLSGITSGVTILSALNIIDEKFESQQNAINAVKQYNVASGDLINVSLTSASLNGITTDTFTVSVDQAELSGKFNLAKINNSDSTYASQYQLTYNGNRIGTTIDIPKDQFLKGASYIPSEEVLRLEFQLDAEFPETEEKKYVDIPVGDLVDEYTAGNGITISDDVPGDNTISINVAPSATNDNKFINLTAAGLGLSGITTAISGEVDGANYAQIVNLPSGYTAVASSIVTYFESVKPETRKNTLFVDTNGQTALYFAASKAESGDDTPSSIIDISQEYIATSGEVTSGNFEKLMTVEAISGYVAAQVDAVKTEIEPKAIEMLEISGRFGTVNGAPPVSASVPGRVIAVYDNLGDQVYPTIKYASGVSTLSADAPSAEYTIIYAKRIGQDNGSLPPYVQIPAQPENTQPENGESTEG